MILIRKNQQLLISMQKVIDVVIMFLAIILAFCIRFYNYAEEHLGLEVYITYACFVTPIYIWLCKLCKLYEPYRTRKWYYEFARISEATIIITVISLTIAWILKTVHLSRLMIILFMVINIVLMSIVRFILRFCLRTIRSRGYNIKYILLIGEDRVLKKITDIMKHKVQYGYAVTKYRGDIKDLSKYLDNNLIDEIFISTNDSELLKTVYNISEKYGIKINIIPAYLEFLSSRMYIDEFLGTPIINIREIPLESLLNRILKRSFDIVFSLFVLIVSMPVMVITAIIIKITSKGPVFYKQRRVGINRKSFYMYKFRSMNVDNSFKGNVKADEEERCTKFGKFIRRYRIDEIPQFFNALVGNMSVVGPRPEIPTLVKKYKEEIPNYMLKHRVKSGITGLAQVNGFIGDTSLKKRIEFDNEYINNWSILLDFKIIFLTIPFILKNKSYKK